MTEKIVKSEQQWKEQLSPEQYQVCRKKGTERAFTGAYWDLKEVGVYQCRCCGASLFSSASKFDSGTGWPSFFEPMSRDALDLKPDQTLWMKRTEVVCSRCDSHLGHVFDDGPEPTGKRYCINSLSLLFQKASEPHLAE